MNYADTFEHVAQEVAAELMESVQIALDHGAQPDQIILDPGLGFGKERRAKLPYSGGHGVSTGSGISDFARSLAEVLPGGYDRPEEPARAGLCDGSNRRSWLLFRADILRVHNVGAMMDVLRVLAAIEHERGPHLQPRAGGNGC